MTRNEFLEEIDSFGSLWNFAYEHDLEYYFDDVITYNDRDEVIDDSAIEILRDDGWRECLYYLNERDCDGEFDYYEKDGYDLTGIDNYGDKFEELKSEILEECDEREDFWDEDEEENAKEDEVIIDEEEGIDESELSDFLSNITKVA